MYSGVAGEGWQPWDYAAGWLFIEEAGGIVSQVRTPRRTKPAVYSSCIHRNLCRNLNKRTDYAPLVEAGGVFGQQCFVRPRKKGLVGARREVVSLCAVRSCWGRVVRSRQRAKRETCSVLQHW